MSIALNIMNSSPLDLAIDNTFLEYYHTSNTFTRHIIEKEINHGHYEDPDFKEIFKDNDAVIIDAGANIGLFTLHLHRACKKIFSVEPTERHFNVLKNLIKIFDIHNVELHNIALNNFDGECSFIIDNNNTTQNRIEPGGTATKCLTLLSFIKSLGVESVDLLKLDIEGGEKFVILEDPTFDEASKLCKKIYIELHPSFVDVTAVLNKLSSVGFRLKFINSPYLNNNLNVLAYR